MIDDHLGDNPSLFVFSARSRLQDLVHEISLAVKPRDLVKVYMVILGFFSRRERTTLADNFSGTTNNMNKDRR